MYRTLISKIKQSNPTSDVNTNDDIQDIVVLANRIDTLLCSLNNKTERWQTLQDILLLPKPSLVFIYLEQQDRLEKIFPELVAGKGLMQNCYHKYDVYYHSLYTCDAAPEDNIKLRLAGLLHDLGKVPTWRIGPAGEPTFHNHEILGVKIGKKILARFGAPLKMSQNVKFLIRHHMFYYTQEWTDRAVRRFLNKVNEAQLEDLIRLRLADRIGSGKRKSLPKEIQSLKDHIRTIKQNDSKFKVRDLMINGYHLMDLGVSKGPQIGEILTKLVNEVTAETIVNEFDQLKRRSQEIMLEKKNRHN